MMPGFVRNLSSIVPPVGVHIYAKEGSSYRLYMNLEESIKCVTRDGKKFIVYFYDPYIYEGRLTLYTYSEKKGTFKKSYGYSYHYNQFEEDDENNESLEEAIDTLCRDYGVSSKQFSVEPENDYSETPR